VMRRVIALGLWIAGVLLWPAAAAGQVAGQDSVSGSGHVLLTGFTGSATSGPSGENPTGFLTLGGFFSFTATPTCLNVSGNEAVVGYRIDTGPQAGLGFIVSVADFGLPVNGQPVDIVRYTGLLPTPPTTCPEPGDSPPPDITSAGGGPLDSGDFTVHDAQPLPTSNDQCKNGGWRKFPDFKNQGQCVSFVATDGQKQT
jgi:hypothetical protein